jgi:hypothetical protein
MNVCVREVNYRGGYKNMWVATDLKTGVTGRSVKGSEEAVVNLKRNLKKILEDPKKDIPVKREKDRDEISLESVEDLYKFLQGKVPHCLTLREPPKLSKRAAFAVIYYLQEIMHLIPDHYERCNICGVLYDIEQEGGSDERNNYCDYHLPQKDNDA